MTLARLVHPSLVGFDRFNNILDALEMVTDKPSFPHHNVIKTGENLYTVELAVAGFSKEDIDVEVEKNVLHIRGKIMNEIEFAEELAIESASRFMFGWPIWNDDGFICRIAEEEGLDANLIWLTRQVLMGPAVVWVSTGQPV